jgi:hypothetical protein
MLRFRHFSGSGASLDEAINRWIQEEDPDVRFMAQSQLPDGSVTVSFIYEESFVAHGRRLSREHGLDSGRPPPGPSEKSDARISGGAESGVPPVNEHVDQSVS